MLRAAVQATATGVRLVRRSLLVSEEVAVTSPRLSGCTGKLKFGSESAAMGRAAYRNATNPKFTLYAYECPHCHCWHLTRWTPAQQARAGLSQRTKGAT